MELLESLGFLVWAYLILPHSRGTPTVSNAYNLPNGLNCRGDYTRVRNWARFIFLMLRTALSDPLKAHPDSTPGQIYHRSDHLQALACA